MSAVGPHLAPGWSTVGLPPLQKCRKSGRVSVSTQAQQCVPKFADRGFREAGAGGSSPLTSDQRNHRKSRPVARRTTPTNLVRQVFVGTGMRRSCPKPKLSRVTASAGAGPGTLTAVEGVCSAASNGGETAPVKSDPGPPTTPGSATSRVRLIVWCWDCRHQVEPDPVETAERCGAETRAPDWPDLCA